MKTKILLSLAMLLVAMFSISMVPKKTKALFTPLINCPYKVKNMKGCPITVSYSFVTTTNTVICNGTITVPAGNVGIIPCCSGGMVYNVYINVTQIGSMVVTQTPGPVSGPGGFGNIQNAGGACSSACGGSFSVNWTMPMTTVL